ncbi:MAG: GNAT family N-acetyltransferase, partial [Gemmatimonadales bacterium]
AERDGASVGRIAAIHNRLHNETHHDQVGFFGFFESIDDVAVAAALSDAASRWLAERSLTVMRGPASPSVNDEYGLLISGFDRPNTILMPHNPSYYPALLEGAGLTVAKTLVAFEGGSEEAAVPAPERITRAVELTKQRYGVTIRAIRLADFKAEVERIKVLYNRCWESNWGAVPMTEHEIDHLAAQFRPVVVPEMVPFAEKDGEPIGFGLALPDFNQVLRSNRKGRMFPAALKLLWSLKTRRIRRARILLLGVLPEYRGKGVDAALYHWIWTHSTARQITWGEAGWVLEDNPAMNAGLVKMGFTQYKRYAIYERPV